MLLVFFIIPSKPRFVKKKNGGRSRRSQLSLTEGLAVGTLIHGGVCFVSAHQDTVQRAVVLGVAVVSALLDGAFDALVGVAVHIHDLLYLGSALV